MQDTRPERRLPTSNRCSCKAMPLPARRGVSPPTLINNTTVLIMTSAACADTTALRALHWASSPTSVWNKSVNKRVRASLLLTIISAPRRLKPCVRHTARLRFWQPLRLALASQRLRPALREPRPLPYIFQLLALPQAHLHLPIRQHLKDLLLRPLLHQQGLQIPLNQQRCFHPYLGLRPRRPRQRRQQPARHHRPTPPD